MQGPTSVQGATIRNVFDPIAIWDEPPFCHHVFKFIHITFSKSPFLRDVARELELSPCVGPQSHVPCSVAWCRWTLHLGQCGPWPLCPGASQTHRAYLSGAYTGDSVRPYMNVHWKGLSPRSLRATHKGNRLHTLLRTLLFVAIAHQTPNRVDFFFLIFSFFK